MLCDWQAALGADRWYVSPDARYVLVASDVTSHLVRYAAPRVVTWRNVKYGSGKCETVQPEKHSRVFTVKIFPKMVQDRDIVTIEESYAAYQLAWLGYQWPSVTMKVISADWNLSEPHSVLRNVSSELETSCDLLFQLSCWNWIKRTSSKSGRPNIAETELR